MSAQEIKVPDIGDFSDDPGDRDPRRGGRHRRGRGPVGHAGIGQGHPRCTSPGSRDGDRAAGRRGRHRVRRQRDHGDRRRGRRRRPGSVGHGTDPAGHRDRSRAAGGRGYGGAGGRREHRTRRPARRGARARRRAGRLHRSVPGRRPRQAGRHDRQPRPARRGVPERGLHPVQGAAARGQGDRRDQGDVRPRAGLRRADRRPGRAARLEDRAWSTGSPVGCPGWPNSARSPPWSAPASSPRRTWSRSPPTTGRPARSASSRPSSPPAPSRCTLPFVPHDDPAGDQLRRRAGAAMGSRSGCSSWAAGSSAWRWRPSTTSWAQR